MSEPFERAQRSCFNLTHYCKLIPESHAIFVMPRGCTRILRLSAIEEGISDRFTMFHLEQTDLISGDTESILLDGAAQTIERLAAENRRPKIFCLFVSCVDSFIGTDHDYVLHELRQSYPDILFFDLAVDPINRATMPPLVRVHNTITALFTRTGQERSVNWLGHYLPPSADDPLVTALAQQGIRSRHLLECQRVTELQSFGNSLANIVASPVALPAAQKLQARLGIPYYNLQMPEDPQSLTKEALLAL